MLEQRFIVCAGWPCVPRGLWRWFRWSGRRPSAAARGREEARRRPSGPAGNRVPTRPARGARAAGGTPVPTDQARTLRDRTHWKETPIYVILYWKLRGLSPNFHIHVSVGDVYIPRIGPHISCSRIGRSILWIYKSLTDTWMLKLGLCPRNSFSGNICFQFSILVLCSIEVKKHIIEFCAQRTYHAHGAIAVNAHPLLFHQLALPSASIRLACTSYTERRRIRERVG
jgi:hypothetical protein